MAPTGVVPTGAVPTGALPGGALPSGVPPGGAAEGASAPGGASVCCSTLPATGAPEASTSQSRSERRTWYSSSTFMSCIICVVRS